MKQENYFRRILLCIQIGFVPIVIINILLLDGAITIDFKTIMPILIAYQAGLLVANQLIEAQLVSKYKTLVDFINNQILHAFHGYGNKDGKNVDIKNIEGMEKLYEKYAFFLATNRIFDTRAKLIASTMLASIIYWAYFWSPMGALKIWLMAMMNIDLVNFLFLWVECIFISILVVIPYFVVVKSYANNKSLNDEVASTFKTLTTI